MTEVGISDVLGCYKGKFFAIELKMEGNKTTLAQDDFIDRARRAGGVAEVAYSVEKAVQIVEKMS